MSDDTLVLRCNAGRRRQTGVWTVPERIVADAGELGRITIDFTQAECAHRRVTLEASCGQGRVRAFVPPGWSVTVDPASTNRPRIDNRVSRPGDPDKPELVVIGHPVLGWVEIRRRQPRGW